jgi:anti-sigma B factor antagonist
VEFSFKKFEPNGLSRLQSVNLLLTTRICIEALTAGIYEALTAGIYREEKSSYCWIQVPAQRCRTRGEGQMNTQSAIMIKLPETFGGKEARKLGRELKSRIAKQAHNVVVDLSRVRQIDLAGLEGLLDCMEVIARNDGSLRLGDISAEAATILELTQMDRLFQKFPAFEATATFTQEEELSAESEGIGAEEVVQPQPVAA